MSSSQSLFGERCQTSRRSRVCASFVCACKQRSANPRGPNYCLWLLLCFFDTSAWFLSFASDIWSFFLVSPSWQWVRALFLMFGSRAAAFNALARLAALGVFFRVFDLGQISKCRRDGGEGGCACASECARNCIDRSGPTCDKGFSEEPRSGASLSETEQDRPPFFFRHHSTGDACRLVNRAGLRTIDRMGQRRLQNAANHKRSYRWSRGTERPKSGKGSRR